MSPRPTPAQQRWQKWEIGALFSFDLTTYREDGADHCRDHPLMDPEVFRPDALDTDQWLEVASAAGVRYALLTASHESGFMNWQSDLYPYGLRHISWRQGRADLVQSFIESCRRFGIAPGLFIGLRNNTYLGARDYQIPNGTVRDQANYRRICESQVEELCSRYGPLAEIWIEGGADSPEEGGPDILPIVEHYQPDTVFYHSPQRADHRWVGNERGIAGDPCWATMPTPGGRLAHAHPAYRNILPTGDPDAPLWCPAMCDVPLRDHAWFWHPGQDHLLRPLDSLLTIHEQSVGRNAVLTLGLAPDSSGLLPEADCRLLRSFGRAVQKRYGSPLARTVGNGPVWSLEFSSPRLVRAAVFQEDIAGGERVRAWRLLARSASSTRELARGTSIGSKRIQSFHPLSCDSLHLEIDHWIGDPPNLTFEAFPPEEDA